jgi:hypothetical protein
MCQRKRANGLGGRQLHSSVRLTEFSLPSKSRPATSVIYALSYNSQHAHHLAQENPGILLWWSSLRGDGHLSHTLRANGAETCL